MGRTATPAVLSSSSGALIRGTYRSPQTLFGLGVDRDIQPVIALSLRLNYVSRDITYTESNGFSTVSGELLSKALHMPVQVRFIPKRWVAFGVGAYLDYSLKGNLGTDLGTVFSLAFDVKLSRKVGLTAGFQYNTSFYSYDSVTPQEIMGSFGLRWGPNTRPQIE